MLLILLNIFISANAMAEMSYTRIGGVNRYDTGKLICDKYGDDFENIILVSGENFPDALCSAPLAKKLNAPIVLTGTEFLDVSAEQMIKEKGVKKVTIIGNAISIAVEDKIKSMGLECIRIGGQDRYETSVLVAKQLGDFDNIVVVYGENYPDALSIAPIAANKGMPILLVNTNEIPEVVKLLIKEKKINNTYVIGATGVISDKVKDDFPNPERIAGANRYKTNLAIINRFKEDLNKDFAYVTSAVNFPDALSGAALAQKNNSPIMLVSESVDMEEAELFKENLKGRNNIFVFGSEGAVSKLSLYNIGIEKKPEPPKPKIIVPSWTSSFNVFNASQTTPVYIKKNASYNSSNVGYGYGDLQEVKILGSEGNFYYVEALDYGTLNYIRGYVSKSMVKTITPSGPYNILVDKTKQRVYIFNNSDVIKEYACSTGMSDTPTPSGRFLVGNKGHSFNSDGGVICYYWTRLDNNYLFHSVLYDNDGYVIKSEYDKLGSKASHGCIRLPYYDAKWISDNVPAGTLVTITD